MAQEDGKIYITISDRRIGEGGGEVVPENPDTQTDEDKKKKALTDYLKHRFFNFVEQQAKQMATYTIENIGNFTGDYQYQREISVGVQILNEGITLASSFGSGMAMGGVVGGVAAVVITVASQTINFTLQEQANRVSNRNQNYNIQQLRDISGLNALTNGSR